MVQIYFVKYDGVKNVMIVILIQCCYFNKINDIVFFRDFSDLFVMVLMNDIWFWNFKDMKELLCIEVVNVECELKDFLNQECYCCVFMLDGKMIISGWSDGCIWVYVLQIGKLQYIIVNVYQRMGVFVGFDNMVFRKIKKLN